MTGSINIYNDIVWLQPARRLKIKKKKKDLPWFDTMSDGEDDAQKETECSDRHVGNAKVGISAAQRRSGGDNNGLGSREFLHIKV